MKWLFGLVVVLNLLVGFYATLSEHPPVDIRAQEVSPDELVLVPAGRWAAEQATDAPVLAAASAPAGDVASAPATSLPAATSPTSAPASERATAAPAKTAPAEPPLASANPAVVLSCAQWGPLDSRLLTRVQGGLGTLGLKAAQLDTRTTEAQKGSGRFWVHHPPLATQAETQTLSSELREKGFDNYIVQNDGAFRGHLSLGLFGREDAARALAARIRAAGFAKVAVEQRSQTVQASTLVFRALEPAQLARLNALQKRLTPGIALDVNPCR
ncbi:Sporulation related domain [Gulbenkiania indica]|uniref:Sporulation related domain n=2 Tax=Gulbenkiania TaxID=397456 RepID=A0A0K6GTW3_9NEIS|nr:SPOR domain-containing protein [Gulbenkiania indica]TCW31951.1 sporulation related protein [Gulbenkiania mobilis]CUA82048.1 Sporulation related domain [Gulbenkiania indica]